VQGNARKQWDMDVSFSTTRRVAVLTVPRQLHLADGPALHQALPAAAHAESLVVVDARDLTFLDSALAGMLVAAAARVMAYGRHLVVAQAKGQPLRVLAGLGASYLLTSVREPERHSLLDLRAVPPARRGVSVISPEHI
jgi:anti-anti-sigma regulatory factor